MSFISRLITWYWANSDRRRDRGLTTPEDVVRFDVLSYGPDPAWHKLDVYRPGGTSGVLPVIVSIHGGGYVYGSTEQYQFYCMGLARSGFAVVSFNYRLAPEHIFPAPLEDTDRVMHWLLDHAVDYGLDTGNVFLVGDSAGAQLVSQYVAMWSDPAYAALMGITPPAVRIGAVGLNCGMYDLPRELRRPSWSAAMYANYFTRRPEVWGEKLDVLSHVSAAFPPTYLMSAPGDFLMSRCRPMAELLRSRGVETAWKIYGDGRTGHVFHLNVRSPLAGQANREELAFFRRFLRLPTCGQAGQTT